MIWVMAGLMVLCAVVIAIVWWQERDLPGKGRPWWKG